MAVSIDKADAYVDSFVIDNADWVEAEPEKKDRILNVASRELDNKFGEKYVIPDEAVYEYASTLAVVFNDTNRMQLHGIASFSITGVGAFTFKENNVKSASGLSLEEFITSEVLKIIGRANGVKLGGRSVKTTVIG